MATTQYHYVATSQQPTAVNHAAVGNFVSATELNLVLAKVSQLQISTVTPGGLVPLFDVPIHGRIASMELVRLKGDTKHTLIFTTERLQFVAMVYDEAGKALKTVATGDLRDRIGRQIERGQLFAVDPLSRVLALQFYEGHLKVVPCDRGFRERAFNVLLQEFALRDMAFLHPAAAAAATGTRASSSASAILASSAAASAASAPRIAVLYEDEQTLGRVCVNVYELDLKERVLRAGLPRPIAGLDSEASILIPVPSPLGGVVALARTSVGYLSLDADEGRRHAGRRAGAGAGSGPAAEGESITIAPVAPRAWGAIDATRFLIADATGGLHLLVLQTSTPADEEAALLAGATGRAGRGSASGSAGGLGASHSATAAATSAAVGAVVDGAGRSGPSLPPNSRVTGLSWHSLGVTVQASTVSYLDAGLVFLGSTVGDPQLIRLVPGGVAPAAGSVAAPAAPVYFEVVTAYQNLGPIVDMCAMDLDRQGQCQVVSCSGVGRDGSLRVVRNGIGIEEQAVVDLPGITGLWSLRGPTSAASSSTAPSTGGDKYIVQSYALSTRILALEAEGEMEEVELGPGFDLEASTLVAANLPAGTLLQVTPSAARLIDGGSMALLSSWEPSGALAGKHITVAAAEGRQVLLALSGGAVVLLRWTAAAGAGGAPQLQLAGQATMPHEVSCLHLSALELPASLRAGGDGMHSGSSGMDVEGDDAAGAAGNAAPVAAVGLWTDTTVRLLSLATPTLPELASVTLGGDIQSRSVLLVALEGLHYLFASQGDGTLFNFKLRLTSHAPAAATDAPTSSSSSAAAASAFGLEVRERKQVTLGTQPVTLSAFANKGATHVFAACDRPTVLSSAGRKLLYSNVNVGAVTYMAPFDSPSLPDCLALASPEALTLGTVDDIQKLHIRTVPLGEQPRRVAHLRRSRTLAVSVEALTAAAGGAPGEGADGAASDRAGAAVAAAGLSEAAFIRLFDDASFDRLASFQLDPHEIVLALAAVRLPSSGAVAGAGSLADADASSRDAGKGGGDAAPPSRELLAVGTAYLKEGEEEPTSGRILLLAVHGAASASAAPDAPSAGELSFGGAQRSVELVAQREVKGGVFSFAELASGRLAAGINSKVQIYRLGAAGSVAAQAGAAKGAGKRRMPGSSAAAASAAASSSSSAMAVEEGGSAGEEGALALLPEAAFAGNTLALHLDARGDFLLVGDLMKSLTLLRFSTAGSDGGGDGSASGCGCLEEVAAEPSCNWMTAVAALDDGTFVGAEHCHNLYLAVRKTVGASGGAEAAASYLDSVGEYHLGDMVNRFVPGSLVMLPAGEEGGAGGPHRAGPAGAAEAAAGDGSDAEGEAGPQAAKRRRKRGPESPAGNEEAGADGSSASAFAAEGTEDREGGAVSSGKRGKGAAGALGAAVPRPRLIFGTVGGAIGALISLPPPLYRFLVTLQRAMNLTLYAPGALSHSVWRSWFSDRRVPNTAAVGGLEQPSARGFVDGDLIELLLDLDRPTQEKVAAAMTALKLEGGPVSADVAAAALHPSGSSSGQASVEEIVKCVEDLSRLH